MASIQRRGPHKDGSYSYRVAYREDRKQQTKTFYTLAEAEAFAASLDSPVGRRAEVTGFVVEDWTVTRAGGSASVRITWDWVR